MKPQRVSWRRPLNNERLVVGKSGPALAPNGDFAIPVFAVSASGGTIPLNPVCPMHDDMKPSLAILFAAGLLACSLPSTLTAAELPKVGDKAPDFSLKTLDDQTVRLSDLMSAGKVVLVVLRGWPGYQCPICERQVEDFIASAAAFDSAKARVVMVYPGPADDLKAHAKEFLAMKGKQWPKDFIYVIDPDYILVNAYGLRWEAPRETAYPSTFVLDAKGIVRFAKVSKSHGDRARASEILAELKRAPAD